MLKDCGTKKWIAIMLSEHAATVTEVNKELSISIME